MSVSRRLFLLSCLLVPLASCGSTYKTDFPAPVPADVSRNWRLAAVAVDVPASLTVTEAKGLVPKADIVWREDDPKGDRHAQVAAIMQTAVAAGARGLRGHVPVELQVRVSRFHALTFEAERTLSDAGVHNIQFDITVRDRRSGQVLAGPTHILADLPALSGQAMKAARARGETQKSQIEAHVAATVAAWLGVGPDVRGSFTRLGD
jgi:hypothetical protein